MFGNVRLVFGTIWKIFGNLRKVVGNLRKIIKNAVISILYNKQNNTWTLGDMEFIFSCSHSISHSFAALTRSISMWTLEDKFHISARPCIILYLKTCRNYLVLFRGIQCYWRQAYSIIISHELWVKFPLRVPSMCSVNNLLCINDIFDARGHDQPARTLAKQLRFNHQVFSCCISHKQGRNQDFFGGRHNSPNALIPQLPAQCSKRWDYCKSKRSYCIQLFR